MTAAAYFFSRKLDKRVSETTVYSIKNEYFEELGVKWRNEGEDTGEFPSLPAKKRDRQLLLGHLLDLKVQLYLKKVREGGRAISARIAMVADRGILLKCE